MHDFFKRSNWGLQSRKKAWKGGSPELKFGLKKKVLRAARPHTIFQCECPPGMDVGSRLFYGMCLLDISCRLGYSTTCEAIINFYLFTCGRVHREGGTPTVGIHHWPVYTMHLSIDHLCCIGCTLNATLFTNLHPMIPYFCCIEQNYWLYM